MAKTHPTTIRLTDEFKGMVSALMTHRRFNDRTAYFEQVIREEWERHGGDEVLRDLIPAEKPSKSTKK